MAEVKHPRMAEAIANAEKAAVCTRGMYPVTKAAHVFTSDGSPLEIDEEEETETETPVEDLDDRPVDDEF